MEPVIELNSCPNQEDLCWHYKKARPKKNKKWIAVYGIILMVCLPLSWYLKDLWVLAYGLLCGCYGVWLYFWPRRAAKKRYKSILDDYGGRFPPCRIYFGENISFVDDEGTLLIPYEKIGKIIVEDERMHIERHHDGGWYIVALNEFIRGDVAALCRFLREKCPNAKFEGFPKGDS